MKNGWFFNNSMHFFADEKINVVEGLSTVMKCTPCENCPFNCTVEKNSRDGDTSPLNEPSKLESKILKIEDSNNESTITQGNVMLFLKFQDFIGFLEKLL